MKKYKLKRQIVGFSAFAGVDVARMAMFELGVDVKWYSSEIDKFAIKGAKALFDDTTYLGDLKLVLIALRWKMSTLIKAYNSEYLSDRTKEGLAVATALRGVKVDVLFGGFPCQAWSLAGKQGGDSDPRGALVHTLLGIWDKLKKINPEIKFMFENVAMKKEFLDYINKIFGCEPTLINSALLTAQNRKRNYWSNWEITQPDDKGILLEDILDPVNPDAALRPCELRDFDEKALCHHAATTTDIKANESNKRIYAGTGKSPTVTTMGGGHREPKVLIAAVRGRYVDNSDRSKGTTQKVEINYTGKSNCLTTVQKDNVVVTAFRDAIENELNSDESIAREKERLKCHPMYRKLTPRECMRLQGYPEWVIEVLLSAGISNSQLYKMTGNSFTCPVITHNLICLFNTGWMQ